MQFYPISGVIAPHYFHMPSTAAHPSPLIDPPYQTSIKLEPFDSTMIQFHPMSRSAGSFSPCTREPSMFYSYNGHVPDHLSSMGEVCCIVLVTYTCVGNSDDYCDCVAIKACINNVQLSLSVRLACGVLQNSQM